VKDPLTRLVSEENEENEENEQILQVSTDDSHE
jgi:hypothetical protein